MPAPLVKAVAILLLMMQVAISLVPGQVLCIPVAHACDEPEQEVDCEHCDTHSCTASPVEVNQECGPFSTVLHPDDPCGRHVHVLIPDDEKGPSSPRGDNIDLRAIIVPLMLVVVLQWDYLPACVAMPTSFARDFHASDQVRAIKTTRLLI